MPATVFKKGEAMADENDKPEDATKPGDGSNEDVRSEERRNVLRRSEQDRRDPTAQQTRVPDRRMNGDRRTGGRRKSDVNNAG
jgi:hypothetical protein